LLPENFISGHDLLLALGFPVYGIGASVGLNMKYHLLTVQVNRLILGMTKTHALIWQTLILSPENDLN
jgi:hypothetical protein